ncbi:MAG: sodium/proton-translocating pyrophosphatase, partial [Thermoplasmata archaeon]|nr:sodium/proton-translocating pyrophosphatase [Thermoplasmata archaeon]
MFLEGASDFEVIALWITMFVALSGLLYAFLLKRWVDKQPNGTAKMQEISGWIQEGAETYLRKQLKTVAIVVVILAAALFMTAYAGMPDSFTGTDQDWFLISMGRMLAFVMGAGFSAAVGYYGMRMAVKANVKVAQAS